MSELPGAARAVVIGCGIVGSSVAHHLTRLGWSDVVLLDKGPLPNPGGSTGHASNFIFPVDHSKEMTALTLDSVRQYEELGAFTQSGGIEVARTDERMQELWRRVSSAKSWGVDPVSMITPAEIEALVPYVDGSVLLGGFYTPSVGIVDSLGACARAARAGGGRRLPRDRGGRDRRRARARTAGADDLRRRRGGDRGDRVRGLEPEGRTSRGCRDPADACGTPDDRRRARLVVRRRRGDRVPDRPRHGHRDVRAPAVRAAGDRLIRAPADPARPRRSAAGRRGRSLSHRAAVHGGRLRAAARGREGADAVPPRRVGAGREGGQRDPFPHARRRPDRRRDARR